MSGPVDVLFAVLPFAAVREPTIGASILQATTARAGFSSRVRYFGLDLARLIGLPLYDQVSGMFASRSLVGDWVFAEALFGDEAPDEQEYVSHLLSDYTRWEDGVPYGADFGQYRNFTHYVEQDLLPKIQDVRSLAGAFVDRCVEAILAEEPRLVAFTSSCHQACSCLAVARRLKEAHPPTAIVFGGANCHGEMGLQWLRSFPWIDYVCTGEGDEVFPEFLQRLFHENDPRPLPGLLKQGASDRLTMPPLVTDLDAVPMPDHSDYFAQLAESPIRTEIGLPRLPLETSRGCWWGEKRQCVFCGNHPMTIPFRSKSADRVVLEIKEQTGQHEFGEIRCVDDALDREHIETVFPKLKEIGQKLPIFYQTRPNLERHELLTLRAGGVQRIQPGIESFSDEVLHLMRKGRTGLQNIQLTRWCAEVGMGVTWNILYGFSGEPPREYERMAALTPLLTHLPPPSGCTWIALKRFSPYWLSPKDSGLRGVRPWPSYSRVFPLQQEEITGLAYFFDFDYADDREPFEYSRDLRREVGQWITLWQVPPRDLPRLDLRRVGKVVLITDTRPCAVRPAHRLKGLAADICCLCDTARSIDDLAGELGDHVSRAEIRKTVDTLVADKLMVEGNGKYLTLAIMRNRPSAGKRGKRGRSLSS